MRFKKLKINKFQIKILAFGICFVSVGMFFLIYPKTVIDCTELGQILLAAITALVLISLANLYLNIRALRRKMAKRSEDS